VLSVLTSSGLRIAYGLEKDETDFRLKIDEVVISQYFSSLSFLRKQESTYFNGFWTPAFAGVTDFGLFTRPSRLNNMVQGSERKQWHGLFDVGSALLA
jgi:hypothetical protein